jgi:hypothetical protein
VVTGAKRIDEWRIAQSQKASISKGPVCICLGLLDPRDVDEPSRLAQP